MSSFVSLQARRDAAQEHKKSGNELFKNEGMSALNLLTYHFHKFVVVVSGLVWLPVALSRAACIGIRTLLT